MRKLILLFSILFFVSLYASEKHPYHVGSVEFNYNSKSKTFEVSAKFFLDDLENALNLKYRKELHFNDKKFKNEINLLLKKYCEENLKLRINKKFVTLNYLGFEENAESVDFYLESDVIEKPEKVETSVSLLYNLFDDQLNIIHVIVNGNRKSSKLSYPNRYLFQQF